MAAPTVDDLAAFMGRELTDEESSRAQAVIAVVTAHASAHTRGQGFIDGVPNSDIRAVILPASVRLFGDPTQSVEARTMGPFSVTHRHTEGWTTWELVTLNRYRQRAM